MEAELPNASAPTQSEPEAMQQAQDPPSAQDLPRADVPPTNTDHQPANEDGMRLPLSQYFLQCYKATGCTNIPPNDKNLWESKKDILTVFMNPAEIPREWHYKGQPLRVETISAVLDREFTCKLGHAPKFQVKTATEDRGKCDIRVGFSSTSGAFAMVGPLAIRVQNDAPTMSLNLGIGDDAYKRYQILHEFGHAMGLMHEHQRPKFKHAARMFIDFSAMEEDVLRMGFPTIDWMPNANDYKQDKKYDPDSIMHYWIERSWLREEYREPAALEQFKEDKRLSNEGKVLQGLQRRIQNLPDELSELDKQWIRKLYQRQMRFKDLVLVSFITSGGCGSVYKGRWKHWKHKVAIKEIQEGKVVHFEREVDKLCQLEHPNIVALFGSCFKKHYYYIVEEWANCGSLQHHIAKNKGDPDMVVSLRWADEITEGMCYLHDSNIVHRDLKPANILLSGKSVAVARAKICDFDIARTLKGSITASGQAGTHGYMAPEIIKETRYSNACDVFSFGMVLWVLATHGVPYEKLTAPFLIQTAIVDKERPEIPCDFETYITNLIKNCWKDDRNGRPSFADVRRVLNTKEILPVESE